MKKYYIAVFLMLFGEGWVIFAPPPIYAQTAPRNEIIISELSTGSPASATEEFIELFNNTSVPIALKSWKLQYASSAAGSWSTKLSWPSTETRIIAPNDYFLLATTGYLADLTDGNFDAGLSATGGHIRLIDSGGGLQDLVGWGTASAPLGRPAPAPKSDESLARLFQNGLMSISNDNAADFTTTVRPTPESDNVIVAAEGPAPGPGAGPYLSLEITELLPNPAPPQSDAANEYIELYNPNPVSVDLAGWTLATGNASNHKYQIKTAAIEPGAYLAFYSLLTKLALANSGGRATLLAPDGTQVDQTAAYPSAPEGQAWIFAKDQWQWTTMPTPGQANVFDPPAAKASSDKKVAGTTGRSSSASRATKGKSSAKKSRNAVLGKKTSDIGGPNIAADGSRSSGLHPWILAAVGSLALLYALYEYRHDMANTLYKLRRNRAAGRAVGQTAEKSGGARATLRPWRWKNHLRAWLGTRTWL